MKAQRSMLLLLALILVLTRTNQAQKTVCTQEAVADLVFLVDGSWSIGTENFEQIRLFLSSLVSSFDVDPSRVRVGLVQYSNTPRTEFHLNTFQTKADILEYIHRLPYMGGGTNTGLGLDFLLTDHFTVKAGSRANQNVPQIAVVITDGKSQDDVMLQARKLRKRGILLYAIGIKDADKEQLEEIAEKNIYNVSNFNALQEISINIVQTLCTTVEEAKRQITQLSKECMKATVADIVFLIDGSSSINPTNFQEVRKFLQTVVSGLDIGPDKVRVGLAQYSDEPYQEFLLKEHMDNSSLQAEIERFPYRTGGTETGKAIEFIRTRYFTEEAGSRLAERVPQIAVVVTDGDSTDNVLAPALALKQMGVLVFTIGVGQADLTQLQQIASRPFQRFMLEIDSYQALQRLTEGLLQTVCVSMEDKRQALAERFADIFFLVDSGLSQTEFQQVRNLIIRLVNQLNVGEDAYRIGLAQYGQGVKVEFLLNAHQTKEQTQADTRKFRQRKLQANEPRNIGAALEYANANFFIPKAGSREEQGFRQYLVVLSGKASDDPVYKAARLVKHDGVTVVGVSYGAPLDELKVVATSPYVYETVTNIVPTLKGVFEMQEVESIVKSDCLAAKLADIVFIVDESGSIGTPNFQLVRTFLHSVISGLQVSPTRVRVGIVTYNDKATAQVYLNSFNEKTDLLNFVKILPYHGGGTNTGRALNFTRENVFTKARGSRNSTGVQQVAVVITDGDSQDDVVAAGADMRRAGVTVYALGVKDAKKDELEKMASYPANKHVFSVDSFAKLKVVELILQKTLCNNIFKQAVSISTRRAGIKEGCVQTDEADIFFLIDHSGSIYPSDFHDMKKFIIEFLHTFRIGSDHVRMGVAKYADDPNLEFDLTAYSDKRSLEKAVENIKQIGGGTETGKALDFMLQHFDNAEKSRGHKVPEYLIVITDGKSSDNVKIPSEKLRSQGVTVYAIGVKNADQEELTEISGDPQKMFFVNNFDALTPIKDDIITDICSTDVCKDASGDLLFLIDSSSSIYPEDYQKMKDFMKSIIAKSSVSEDTIHFGVLQFSTFQQLEFPLNRFYTKDQMFESIDAMSQIEGGTLTGAAIAYAEQYFDAANGGRPELKQRLVVITDGEAQDQVLPPSQKLRDRGVVLYAIGVVDTNSTQLLEISGSPDRVFSERDFNALKDLETELAHEICDPDRDCKKTDKADIIFLVDSSKSIDDSEFQSMQKFMSSVVNQTTVGSNLTRFGLIRYSTDHTSIFTLNTYTTKRQILQAINTMPRIRDDTYTGKALAYSLQFFGPEYGGRAAQKITQILMVITDGDATDRYNLEAPSIALHQNGVSVFSIGVEDAIEEQLMIMAGQNQNRVFYVNNFESLETLHKNISDVICTDIKPECEKQLADLVFLLDQSGSIDPRDFSLMQNFTSELIKSFNISQEKVRVGAALFSSTFQHEFYLNELSNEKKVVNHIMGMRQLGGGTLIGHALESIREYFTAARGSRRGELVSQNLVLITDGDSRDAVAEAALKLKKMSVEIFTIGIGAVNTLELLQITGNDRLFSVQDFSSLDNIKTKVVKTICESKIPSQQTGCSIDIALGFDVSHRSGFVPGVPLLSGQTKLQTFLPEIVHYLSSVPKLCCTSGSVKPNLAFRVLGPGGQLLFDTNFEPYNEGVVRKLLDLTTAQPSYFNSAMIESFRDMFKSKSNAGVKVLVVFSDGLDEDVMSLEQQSDQLLKSGVNALLTVALEGTQDPAKLQMVEFGRGFGYKLPLSVSMHSVGSSILKQIDAVSDRECCNITCKCSGHEGIRGLRGLPGTKGEPGQKGYPGFPGEEGVAGDRGGPGPSGPPGVEGCPGIRGPKGNRGRHGDRGEDGEDGLDGVNGEQGVTGKEGAKGEQGHPGNSGIPGFRGESGFKGQRGLRGDPGEPGTDNTKPGPKGDAGNPGLPGAPGGDGGAGESGTIGNPGVDGRRGPPGEKGAAGPPGEPGSPGTPGASGPQGQRGVRGQPGPRGPPGLPGAQGGPGEPGGPGLSGRRGANGQKGQSGDPGAQGAPGTQGPRGPPGQDGRDGYGPLGLKGVKGDPGFPGYPGLTGEDGLQGPKGFPGPKGNHGRGGNSGAPGTPGDSGDPGYAGHKGPRGPPGQRLIECQMISYIRDNCACSIDHVECPAVPTELVFALDMSEDVTPAAFERQRSALLSLISPLSISESNCPSGARVAVVGYSSRTKYLIRFNDYRRKNQLIEAVKNIALERTSNRRHLGGAMRFTGHNVFKRVRSGATVRKVVVFMSNGPTQDTSELVTAVMELRGLGIVTAVVSLRKALAVENALQVDDTGNSMFTVLSEDEATDLRKIKDCAICYDPCSPSENCAFIQSSPRPQSFDLDLAMVMDGSREVPQDQFRGVQELLGSVVSQLSLSPQPERPAGGQVRVALVQQSTTPYVEFSLHQYQNQTQVQTHLSQRLIPQRGDSALGQTLEYTLRQVLLKTGSSRRRKAMLFTVGTRTLSVVDQNRLDYVSQQAFCKGVAVFVVTMGSRFNRTQVERLASPPLDQHLIHLDRVRPDQQVYAQRFIRVFLSALNKGVNAYPPPTAKKGCKQFEGQIGQGQLVFEEDEEVAEEPPERFQEQTGPRRIQAGTRPGRTQNQTKSQTGQTQVDIIQSWTRGDGQTLVTGNNAVCGLALDSGVECGEYVQRWHYDPTLGACAPFWFGGCGGNANRFTSEHECLSTCGPQPNIVLQPPQTELLPQDACSQSQDPGGCAEYTMMWFFDSVQKECERFWYGGCGGNSNRFRTHQECEALCLGAR